MDDSLTKSEREALKAIYRLTRDGSEAHTGALADVLGLSPGTVTTMVKRLADRDLVDHRPYQGVTFTPVGQQTAIAAIRRHRIIERFLADMLGYQWNEADKLAVGFEHELPDEVLERLYLALHRPATCPHGFPIPTGEDTELPVTPDLYALEPGDVAEVALSGSTDPTSSPSSAPSGSSRASRWRWSRSTRSTGPSSSPSRARTARSASGSPGRSTSPVALTPTVIARHQPEGAATPPHHRGSKHELHPGRRRRLSGLRTEGR